MPYSWRMEKEVDSYNNVLFYTANDRWIKNIECIVYHQEDDMVQVYNKMSDYNDKSYGLLISQVGIQYTKHLRRSISVCYNREWLEVSRKIRKRWLGFGSITSLKGQLRWLSISCVHATVH
jgi:hypothetical protein